MVGGDGESDHARWGETQRALAALRRQLGVDDQVVFCGRKSQAELRQYYNAADMVLVPSRSESFGLVALEALACGRPVLATATDGLRWVLDEGRYGHLVPCDDVDAMASAITSLLGSEPERAHLATTALARARTLSWDALGTAMFDQYRILLAKQAEETPDCFGRSASEWCLTASKA
jgi:D-inositol-3-phosphate glycosyltransferase